MIMKLLRTFALGKFAAICAVLGFAATATATTATIHVVVAPYSYYGSVSPNYDGQTLANNAKGYTMTAKAKSGYYFTHWTVLGVQISATNKTKLTFSVTNTNELTFIANFADKQKPVLAITSPANNSVLTNPASPTILISGTASDNDLVTNVVCNWIGQDSTNLTVLSGNHFNSWWVSLTLSPGTNYVLAYAVDRSGLCSKTNKLKLVYAAAPTALAGVTINTTNQSAPYFISFGSGTNGTFSDGMDVGSYTYKKTGSLTGKLVLRYEAPPSASNSDMVYLRFTNATAGIFSNTNDTDGDGFTNSSFTLTMITNSLALTDLTGGASILMNYADGTNHSVLTFLTSPTVSSDAATNWVALAKPLTLPLDADYPGNVLDRVKVTFNHLKNYSGTWTNKAPVTLPGTVADIGTSNSVTVLLDKFSYDSNNDNYSVATNSLLTILSFCYTNYSDTLTNGGSGTFTYTNYSDLGSLLKLSRDNTNEFYILTFTDASTNGTFYSENYAVGGGLAGTDSGTFYVEAPPEVNSPSSVTATNGQTVTFSVTATGSQPLGFQWQSSATNTTGWKNLEDITNDWGSVISGSVSNSLTISDITTNDIGYYQVIVTNAFGSVTSSTPAKLTITLIPVITSQPQAVTLNTNDTSATFSVAATGLQPLSYQWLSGTNQLVEGSTNYLYYAKAYDVTTTNLNIESIATNNFSASFHVIVSNDYGRVTSSVVSLTFTNSSGITPGN